MRVLAITFVVVLGCLTGSAVADSSKLTKEGGDVGKGPAFAKNKLCCGYPLSEERGFRMTFYWMAVEQPIVDTKRTVDLYTRGATLIGHFDKSFVKALRMEGSGWLADGRVINYAGRCRYGIGICFELLDRQVYPYGRGAFRRPLVPFTSMAVDRRLVPIGETMYVPELDGLLLPTGQYHDGCVRADDVGGLIKKRVMDFFVVKKSNFRKVQEQLWNDWWFTPHIESPRCAYLRTD